VAYKEPAKTERGKRDGKGRQKGQTGWERQRHRGISGVVLGLRLVSVADGYLWSPVCCGIGCWTGSGWDVRLQTAVGLEMDWTWMWGESKAPPGVSP